MVFTLCRPLLLGAAFVASAIAVTRPVHAAVAPSDQFTFALAGFNNTGTVGYILGSGFSTTFGTTQTFTAAGVNGQDYTFTSSEVVGATTTTDSFKITTPTNFITTTTVSGTKITQLQFDIGDSNSGVGVTTGADPVNLTNAIAAGTYTSTGKMVYGTANTTLTLTPGVTFSSNGLSFTAVEGVNAGTTAISTFAIHEFDFSITYPNPVVTATATTITNTPLQSIYGQPYSIAIATVAATGSTQPTTGTVTCTVQPQPSGTATTIGPVAINVANATAQCAVPATQPAGSYNVTATYSGSTDGAFTGSSSAVATLTIAPANLTISAQTDTKIYDGTTSSTATPTITSGQLAAGDTLSALTQAYASPDVLGTNGSTLVVMAGYTLTNNGNDVSANYQVALATAPGTITPLGVTITPTDGQTKIYGTSDPAAFAYTSSALIGSSTLSGALGRAAGENVGTYAYTLGTLAVSDPANYSLSLAPGASFSITPAALTITPTPGQSKVYGTSDPASFAYTASGLVGGSTVSGALDRVAGETVGTYAYTLGSLAVSDPGNYTVGLAPGNTFAITPASSSVTLSSPCSSVFVGGGNEPYSLTASVSPANGSGTVTFSLDGNPVCSNVALSAGSAMCTVNNLDVQNGDNIDTLHFSADYSGDTNTASSSATFDASVLSAADAIFKNGFEDIVAGCPVE